MYEEKINLISKETLVEKPNENLIFDDIDKETLYEHLAKYNFNKSDFEKIFFAESFTSNDQNEINQSFRDISTNSDLSMIDIVLFLEKDFGDLKKILYFLDGDSKSLLKKQMAKKYNVKIDSNKLYKLLR